MSKEPARSLVRTVCALAIAAITFGSPVPSAAQAPDTSALIGGWRVGPPPGSPEEEYAVLLVNRGGTANLEGSDGDRSMGVWARTGTGIFALTLDEFDHHNDGTVERFRIRVTIRLLDSNAFEGTLRFDQMTLDGSTVLQEGGQFPIAGTRMTVVPE
jgi:hypothetical protein